MKNFYLNWCHFTEFNGYDDELSVNDRNADHKIGITNYKLVNLS